MIASDHMDTLQPACYRKKGFSITRRTSHPVSMENATKPLPGQRAGRYVQQQADYKAFLPAPLPPQPSLRMDEELTRLLSDADRALGRLDGVTQTLPDTNLFLLMYVRKEALYSSQIEGTQASLDDLLAYEDDLQSATNPHDVEEVVNYVAAINYGLKRLDELPVSLRLIRELHQRLMQGVRGQHKTPGQFRTSQNWIGAAGSTLRDALFVPPPPHMLVDVLGELELFLHTETNLPILVQIGMAHVQFETIHPFLDGNGRLGRLLITFLLCEKGVLAQPALYLSHFFKLHRSEYYQRLQDVRDKGDWEAWTKFFLRGVRDVAREAASTASKIASQREKHRALISSRLSNASAGSAFKLIEHMHRSPVVSVQSASDVIGRTYANANQLVRGLEKLGLLEEITGNSRNRRYRYSPYINLFRED